MPLSSTSRPARSDPAPAAQAPPRTPLPAARWRSVVLVALLALPGVLLRLSGAEVPAPAGLLAFGAAVVAASFLLAWAAEAAQKDVSGGLAIAVLAMVAVLPEYAVDLYFAWRAGSDPAYTAYAAANMTGSNRLLMGLGWPLVVLLGLLVAGRRPAGSAQPSGGSRGSRRLRQVTALVLEPGTRLELGFLLVAGVVAFAVPATGAIALPLGVVMLGWFAFYLYRVSRAEAEEPDLVGTAATVGDLEPRRRRVAVTVMFVVAALVVLLSAKPFADSLVETGRQLGLDQFLLVQWLAPLSSEAPEFIVAIMFALRGNARNAVGTLISSKVNQWTLLVGSLPLAYLAGGGGTSIPLDARQVKEVLLTAMQTLMGVSILLTLRFPRWGAWSLLGLFAVQFAVIGTTGRLALCAGYLVVATVVLVRNRRHVLPTLAACFRDPGPVGEAASTEQADGDGSRALAGAR